MSMMDSGPHSCSHCAWHWAAGISACIIATELPGRLRNVQQLTVTATSGLPLVSQLQSAARCQAPTSATCYQLCPRWCPASSVVARAALDQHSLLSSFETYELMAAWKSQNASLHSASWPVDGDLLVIYQLLDAPCSQAHWLEWTRVCAFVAASSSRQGVRTRVDAETESRKAESIWQGVVRTNTCCVPPPNCPSCLGCCSISWRAVLLTTTWNPWFQPVSPMTMAISVWYTLNTVLWSVLHHQRDQTPFRKQATVRPCYNHAQRSAWSAIRASGHCLRLCDLSSVFLVACQQACYNALIDGASWASS